MPLLDDIEVNDVILPCSSGGQREQDNITLSISVLLYEYIIFPFLKSRADRFAPLSATNSSLQK